jgi:hypothetical protein
MPTTYPPGLPDVPDDAWNAKRIADLGIEQPDDARAAAIADFALDADDATQAEFRLLAYINRSTSPEADLRGTTATALEALEPGRWRVRLRVPGEY